MNVALCIGTEALDRLGAIPRHLVVGLVEQAVSMRLVGSDPRIERLQLGPVQTVLTGRIAWPWVGRHIDQAIESLAADPPTVVHAVASDSFRLAAAIADAFDSELVLQIDSAKACDVVGEFGSSRISHFIALSGPLLQVLQEQLGISADRIHLVRPGVRASQEPTCFSAPNRVPTVLCTSSFTSGGGVDKLIDAAALLREHGLKVMLFLLGTGPRERALRQRVRDRKLSAFVTFAQPTGDLSAAFNSADIFVQPALETALTAHGLEAMGQGMAIVALPNAACDFYHHDETAILCDQCSADSLAGAMEKLLLDRHSAQRLAGSAQEYVRKHHAMSAMAEGTAAVYRQLALSRATFSIEE